MSQWLAKERGKLSSKVRQYISEFWRSTWKDHYLQEKKTFSRGSCLTLLKASKMALTPCALQRITAILDYTSNFSTPYHLSRDYDDFPHGKTWVWSKIGLLPTKKQAISFPAFQWDPVSRVLIHISLYVSNVTCSRKSCVGFVERL